MNLQKNQIGGLLSTIIIHVIIVIICFFSSINYAHDDFPLGFEIEILNFNDLKNNNEQLSNLKNSSYQMVENKLDNTNKNIIEDNSQDIFIPDEKDSVNVANDEESKIIKEISLELEDVLSQLNDLQDVEETNTEISHDNLSVLNNANDFIINENELRDDYILANNRLAIKKVRPEYKCDEIGTVVVRVWVNREGVTIKAESGVRGTTDSAKCLLKEAKLAALSTTWTPLFEAPEIQLGTITYNFYQN